MSASSSKMYSSLTSLRWKASSRRTAQGRFSRGKPWSQSSHLPKH